MRKFYFLLVFIFISCTSNAQQTDIFSVENTWKYAQYLENTGQSELAVAEYERILFLNPALDSVRFRILSILVKEGKYDYAFKKSAWYLPSYSQQSCIGKLKHTKLFLLSGKPDSSVSFYQRAACFDTASNYFVRTCSLLMKYQVKEAKLNFLNTSLSIRNQYPEISPMFDDSLMIRHRSPFVSGLLSAVIPGTGKIYSGRWRDGMYSLIIIASNAFSSYRYFDKNGKSSVGGWVFASIGTGFYLGNIFGSVKAARIFNRNEKDRYKHSLQRRIAASF
ncbi:MAG: hypothetical protein V2A54_07475 [Bacteroidota bacterium]